MSGHVEGFFECGVTLTVGSRIGPLGYDEHRIALFMEALEQALLQVRFDDGVFSNNGHQVHDAVVWHVGPTLSSLQHHFSELRKGNPGDVGARADGPKGRNRRKREWADDKSNQQ